MALNLVRNSKVYFTSNVDSSTGAVNASGFTTSNTQEIQVLDGFTFSQNTNQDTVTISEAGVAPVRGQRAFNTSLAPVDFSFSTYVRPYNATTSITCEESVLWNALFSANAIATPVTLGGTVSTATYAFANGEGTITITGTAMTFAGLAVDDIVVISGLTGTTDTLIVNSSAQIKTLTTTSITLQLVTPKAAGAAITGITIGTVKFYKSAWAPVAAGYSLVTSAGSNVNQLQKFGMLFVVDSVVYQVDNCAMNQVMIDFGLDAIATLQWTGQATKLTESAITAATLSSGANPKNSSAPFITNKLSTVAFSTLNALGSAAAGSYTMALTGGSVTINNNITYITPANLGIVNTPAVYYTGTRAITGTINAYLKTGSGVGSTGQLLKDMLAAASSAVEPMAAVTIAVGGSSNGVKVELVMPAVTFSVPTVDVQQVVSTAINFTAQGYLPSATANGNTFDLTETNDLTVRYYAV
jgi:hypothetical protein